MKHFTLICGLTFISLIFTTSGCKKNTTTAVEYKGEVIRGINDCNTAKGFPYIIAYTTKYNTTDTILTASLPSSLKINGTKIIFKINETIYSDEVIVCNSNVIPPAQKSIFDIKSQ